MKSPTKSTLRQSPFRQALTKAGLLVGDPAHLPAIEAIKAAASRTAAGSIAQQETSTVEPWRSHIEPMVKRGAKPRAIRVCLRLSRDPCLPAVVASGFDLQRVGGQTLSRLVALLQRETGVAPEDVVIHFEPGR